MDRLLTLESLRLIKQKNYSLEDIAITFKDITGKRPILPKEE